MTHASDDLDPKLLKLILTRREEDEGGRVVSSRVIARDERGGAALLVIAACVEVRRRDGAFGRFSRCALAMLAGPSARLITIRSDVCADIAQGLLEASESAHELTALARLEAVEASA